MHYTGTFEAPRSPVPGLLVQLESDWVFAARTGGDPDIVLQINPTVVIDLNTVEDRFGTTVIIRFDPGSEETDRLDLLVAGTDSSSAALQIVYALARDAGLVDEAGQPRSEWKARIEAKSPESDIPTGLGYMQGLVTTAGSGVYSIVSESEVIRGMGSTLDGLVIEWDDVDEYWHGEIDYPSFFPRIRGHALVLQLDKTIHGGYDLVIHPFDLDAWLTKLADEGFEIDD